MTAPYYQDDHVTVFHGDCLDILRDLPDNSVESVVTDPPAAVAFMGRTWDGNKGGREQWAAWLADIMREALRVTKPGGHAFVWALPRTSHWTACGIEDAGWQIRDCVVHLFGSGFPKSLDVSKAIDKAAGAEPLVLGPDEFRRARANRGTTSGIQPSYDKPRAAQAAANITAPATDAARTWQGWGTALKPASEHWWLARKPLTGGTVAANVLTYGTGALNIDACRVGAPSEVRPQVRPTTDVAGGSWSKGEHVPFHYPPGGGGRWPANVVLDSESADELDRQSGRLHAPGSNGRNGRSVDIYELGVGAAEQRPTYGETGGASRFFPTFRYEAKAPTLERPRDGITAHPTVKPLDLMRWLVRLVTPRGGTVLDPFAGSGTTAEACILEGFQCIAIEREADYLPLIVARLSKPLQPSLDLGGIA